MGNSTKGIEPDMELLKEFNEKVDKAESIEDELKLEEEYLKRIYKYGGL